MPKFFRALMVLLLTIGWIQCGDNIISDAKIITHWKCDDCSEIYDIALNANYLYLADKDFGIIIVEFSDINHPIEMGRLETGSPQALDVKGNYLFVGDRENNLVIIDISNPELPTQVAQMDTYATAYYVITHGNYCYVGNTVVDITDPTNPIKGERIGAYTSAMDIAIEENLAFIAEGTRGFTIFDITNPAAPQKLGSIETSYSKDVVITRGFAYIVDRNKYTLSVVDYSNPSSLSLIQTIQVGGHPTGIDAQDNYLFIADGADGLDIVDITDPKNPIHKIEVKEQGMNSYKCIVNDDYVYIADRNNGLTIVELLRE